MRVFELLRIKVGVIERKEIEVGVKIIKNNVGSLEDIRRLKKMSIGQ